MISNLVGNKFYSCKRTQKLIATLTASCVFYSVTLGCLKKKVAPAVEDPDDASRFAALRYDGSVTYLFQALIIPNGTPEEFKNDSSIYQCWYRHDTPAKGEAGYEDIAKEGTNNFELFQKFKNEVKNVNAMAVPTDKLLSVMNEIGETMYAKDENGKEIDPSTGGINGTLDQISEESIDAVFSAVSISEQSMEEAAKPENRFESLKLFNRKMAPKPFL